MFSANGRHLWVLGLLAFALGALGVSGCGGSVGRGTSVSMAWGIYASTDTTGSQPLRCSDVGGGKVVLSMQDGYSSTPYSVDFDCGAYEGIGTNIPAGTYMATATLYGDSRQYGNSTTVLGQVSLGSVTLVRGATNQLPPASFVVTLTTGPVTPPAPTGYSTASFTWRTFDIGDVDLAYPLACSDVGGGNVVLTLKNKATGATTNDTFACKGKAGSAASRSVQAGTYDVTVTLYGDQAIYGNATTILDQIVTPNIALLAGSNPLGNLDLLVNSFVLSWTIIRGGVTTTCAAVGATDVELNIYFPGQTTATAYYLPCDSSTYDTSLAIYTAATLAIPYASAPYNISWQAFLLDAYDRDLGQGTVLQTYTVAPDAQADLGTVQFPL